MNRRQFGKQLLAGTGLSALESGLWSSASFGADAELRVREAVDDAVKPVMDRYGIPGMAVGVTLDGARHFIEYGLAARDQKIAVTRETLFELGSVSKTFTATLVATAEVEGKLSLKDTVAQHMPELAGSPVGNLPLLALGTHVTGGFPLQLPDGVSTEAQLMEFYRAWQPKYPPDTRTYANPSVALLGIVTARVMGARFETLMEQQLFPALGLQRTYINVPEAETASYAWGTNGGGKAVRVNPSPIAPEAYGIKSNIVDMIRFVEVNMGIGALAEPTARAVLATHTGYYRAGPFVQDLIWEEYSWPALLADMMAGNSSKLALSPLPATPIVPPMAPRQEVILNKTGSTGGFGAYVMFIPAKRFGIVMLANKGYPNEVRTQAAYGVMQKLVG